MNPLSAIEEEEEEMKFFNSVGETKKVPIINQEIEKVSTTNSNRNSEIQKVPEITMVPNSNSEIQRVPEITMVPRETRAKTKPISNTAITMFECFSYFYLVDH